MSQIRAIGELSALALGTGRPSDEAIQDTLPILQRGLEASDVFLVYGAENGFRCYGSQPRLELNDTALWLVHRDLTTRDGPSAFDVHGERVENFRDCTSRRSCDYLAAHIPIANLTGEMLIAVGPWKRGVGTSRRDFLAAALPALARLLERRLDASRAERQRGQISALANITRVMEESEDLDTVLTSLAGTIATVAGIDYVSIDIVDNSGAIRLRCVNSTRPGVDQLRERWKRGASRPDPVRDTVVATGRPMLFCDSQNDGRIPESGRNYFIRTLIRSTGTFPLVSKDETVGVLSVASHRPLDFAAGEVELLEGLSAQVATAVNGIQLYQDLAQSREELQRLYEQLQRIMGIEHHLARTDALTGIPNRRFIDETVTAECASVRRYGQPLSAVIADLDYFKQVNDTLGHAAGDDTLRFVARLARETCREVDVVGRYGGDEFVFVLPATEGREATAFAERFRTLLETTPVSLESSKPVIITASFGVAQWESESMPGPVNLIRQADRAMYQAKAAGRNRTMVAEGDSARAA